MPNAMSIQQTFNSILSSVSRNYGQDSEASELAKQRLQLAQQAEARKTAQVEVAKEKLGIERTKAEARAAKEMRLEEDQIDKQKRTEGLVAQREAQAAMVKAQAASLKEQTKGEALKRKEGEFALQQKKERAQKKKAAATQQQAQQAALENYAMHVDALNGQKVGLQQRKQMLGGEQITLEI